AVARYRTAPRDDRVDVDRGTVSKRTACGRVCGKPGPRPHGRARRMNEDWPMKDMKAARRMQLTLLSAIVIVGVAASGTLMYALHRNVTLYDQIFATEVAQQDDARVIQVTFKKQVQEWKNILLRGSDYESFKKYSEGFHTEEKTVHDLAIKLQKAIADADAGK